MKDNFQAILGIVDFIIPFEVVSALGLVFTAENILEAYVTTGEIPMVWVWLYLVFVVAIGIVRLATANEEEIDVLEDDLEELTDN